MHGMLFTLISSYLWAQLRLMLQVWCSLAVAFYSFRWRGETKKKQPRRVKHRVTWGARWSPWHILGGQCNHQSNSFMKRSDGTQPFSVLIPSTSTPFTPAVDQERLDLAIRCQTCSASRSGPDGRDMQDTNRKCDKRYTLQYRNVITIKGLLVKDHPFLHIQQRKRNTNAYTGVFKISKTKI